MSVVQLFNREHRAFNDFSAGQHGKQARLDRRHLRLLALLPHRRAPLSFHRHRPGPLARRHRAVLHAAHLGAPPRPSSADGWEARRSRHRRHPGRLHPVRPALLPPNSWTSPTNTTSCKPPWPRPSASSNSSTSPSEHRQPRHASPSRPQRRQLRLHRVQERLVHLSSNSAEEENRAAPACIASDDDPKLQEPRSPNLRVARSRHRMDPQRRLLHHPPRTKPPPSSATPAPARPPSPPS